MKFSLFLCFLALSIRKAEQESLSKRSSLISKSCIPWPTDAAVNNLRRNGKAVIIHPSLACVTYMAEGSNNRNPPKRHYNPDSNTCNMGIPTGKDRSKLVRVYMNGENTAGIGACRREENTVAFFLPYDVDFNSYMILDSTRSYWFFTISLGGCDIFIATSNMRKNFNKPLVVHANANKNANDMNANLKLKGEGADDIIGDHAADDYQLRARVYSVREGVEAYLNTYRLSHPSVRIYAYDSARPTPQSFDFIGFFDEKRGGGAWTFFLKGQISGVIHDITLF